jgi:hypothetical protein
MCGWADLWSEGFFLADITYDEMFLAARINCGPKYHTWQLQLMSALLLQKFSSSWRHGKGRAFSLTEKIVVATSEFRRKASRKGELGFQVSTR